MATTQLSDVIVPSKFTDYITQNTMERTALVTSGIMVKNDVITTQLNAGAHSFTVPFWKDLGNEEADIVSDDPATLSVPLKIQAGKQLVRKSFIHQSLSLIHI